MRFTDLKIGVRLAGGFGLVMLLIVGMAMAGIWRLQSVGDLTEEMVGSASVKERLTAEWHNQIGISGIGVLAFARNTETAESPAITEKAAATRKDEAGANVKRLIGDATVAKSNGRKVATWSSPPSGKRALYI